MPSFFKGILKNNSNMRSRWKRARSKANTESILQQIMTLKVKSIHRNSSKNRRCVSDQGLSEQCEQKVDFICEEMNPIIWANLNQTRNIGTCFSFL